MKNNTFQPGNTLKPSQNSRTIKINSSKESGEYVASGQAYSPEIFPAKEEEILWLKNEVYPLIGITAKETTSGVGNCKRCGCVIENKYRYCVDCKPIIIAEQKVKYRNRKKTNFCIDCGTPIETKSTRCHNCYWANRKRIESE